MEAVSVLLLKEVLKERLLHIHLPTLWSHFDANKSPHDSLQIILNAVTNFQKSLHYKSMITTARQYYPDVLLHDIGVNNWESIVSTCIQLVINIPKVAFPVMETVVYNSLLSYTEEGCNSNEFMSLVHSLKCLGLLECFMSHAVAVAIETKVYDYVRGHCTEVYEETGLLRVVLNELNVLFNGWLTDIYGTVSNEWSCRILYCVYNCYGRLRISELFDIVVDYPDSEPSLQDLKECLQHVNLREELMESLTAVYKRRLLHHGANTAVIITQYISSIRSLRILDPSGVVLERVCDPVRKYLRSRDDTVTCIMASLMDDTSNDLSEELAKGECVLLDLSDDCENSNQDFDSWSPDPVDADPGKSSKSRQTSDVISLLVHIYGSQELFVNEYRTLLADRLLSSLDYDTTKEIRNLELLKLRFGEVNLHYCEVMVKDITDSRRVNGLITTKLHSTHLNETEDDIKINLFILSHFFWPPFKQESIKLPQFIQSKLDVYNKCYQEIKGMRQLEWCSTLGQVQLEVEINGTVQSYQVSPPRACIIWLFQSQNKWTVNELCRQLESVPSAIRRHALYWISQGLLYEESVDTYCVLERDNNDNNRDERGIVEDESSLSSLQDQRENDLQVVWSYVTAMLTNLGPLSLDKIHNMLKMFMPSSQGTVNELKTLLDRKIKNQELLCSNGMYQLNNNNN